MAALTLRLHAARVVAWREVRLAVVGLGGYVAVSLALLAAGWIISNDVRAVRAADVLVLEHPFRTPVTVAVLLVSMFLGVSAVVSVARERDRGTLEVLFYGPIDEASYLAGKLFGQLGAYAAALPVLLIGLALLAVFSGFALTASVIAGLGASVLPVAQVVAVAILLGVLGGRLRNGVLLFIGLTLLTVAITLAYRFLVTVPIDSATSPLLVVRDAIGALDGVVRWVSPFATLERTVDGIALGAWWTVLAMLAVALVYVVGSLLVASLVLRRRGVRAKGE